MDDTEFRRTHLGGSDAYRARVTDPLGVALEKRGEREPQPPTLRMQVGLALEPFVRKLYASETGNEVKTLEEPLEHADIPFFGAHLDGLTPRADGRIRLVELKTTQKRGLYIGDELPPYTHAQVHHYVHILRSTRGDQVDDEIDVAVLTGNSDFKVITVPVDVHFMEQQAEQLQQFWMDYVIGSKSPPKVDPARLVGVVKAQSAIEATPDIRDIIANLRHLGDDERELAERRSRLRAQLCAIMDDAEAVLDGDRVLCTFKEEKPRFSSSKLKEIAPDLYEKCRADKGARILRLR